MDYYDKDLEQALINKRYEQYQKQKINNSDSANSIMNKIKNGQIPNDADVFELCCDDQKKQMNIGKCLISTKELKTEKSQNKIINF